MLLRAALQVMEPHTYREYRPWACVKFRCCHSERSLVDETRSSGVELNSSPRSLISPVPLFNIRRSVEESISWREMRRV